MRSFLRRISPLTNAERITRPLLVVQGKNDPRVPVSEAEADREHGCAPRAARSGICWLADEGHGYREEAEPRCLLQNVRAVLDEPAPMICVRATSPQAIYLLSVVAVAKREDWLAK